MQRLRQRKLLEDQADLGKLGCQFFHDRLRRFAMWTLQVAEVDDRDGGVPAAAARPVSGTQLLSCRLERIGAKRNQLADDRRLLLKRPINSHWLLFVDRNKKF